MDFSSGVHISPFVPPLVAFVISAITSTGGVSGAFLLLPFQMSVLGFTSPAVSATNHLYNVVGIPPGVMRFVRERRMVWPLAWTVVLGTLPGVLIGAIVRVRYLPDPRDFKLFVGAVLLWVAVRMARDLVRRRGPSGAPSGEMPPVVVRQAGWRAVTYEFRGEEHTFRTAGLLALAFVVGVIGGTYGIGGGSIIAPFLVSVFGLPVYTVAGAALLGTFVTSLAGVGFYQAIAPWYPHLTVAPDWLLGILFGVGGMAGTYCGARLQKHVPERWIKAMLALAVAYLGGRYALGWFIG